MSIYDDSIKSHLESQPYKLVDEEGNEISFSANVDDDGDMTIVVDLSDLRTQIIDLEGDVSDLEAEVAYFKANQ
jgi:hypothetical protein